MTVHDGKVRMIDDTPGQFTVDRLDPRNAETVAIQDGMIAMRREAGLPDFPERPLYPDHEVHFEPESGQGLRPGMVAR